MRRLLKVIGEWIPPIAIAFVLSLSFRSFVGEAAKIPSGSMIPTLQINDRLFIEKMIDPSDLRDGDIVVFKPPFKSEYDRLIKRLIGVGGDTIEIRDGVLYRNGEKVDEPYIEEPMNYDYGPITVPEGKFFFLGDNRNNSYDSHLWPTPFVDESEIIGKAVFRYYPFSEMEMLQ
jgi:signal peptidase I